MTHVRYAEYLLGGYVTLGLPESIIKGGVKYTLQRYQGKHKNEFLLQSENGDFLLFENNVLKQQWQEHGEGKVSEEFFAYKNGRVNFRQPFKYISEQVDNYRIVYHKKGLRMEVWSVKTGNLKYHGGYNERDQREGWGIEYDFENKSMTVEGIWSKGTLKEVIRLFNGDTMTELKRNGADSLDPVKRIPIYVGGFRYDEEGFRYDEESERFYREGKGCLIDPESGIAIRECEWKDGKEVSGVDLIEGKYDVKSQPVNSADKVLKPAEGEQPDKRPDPHSDSEYDAQHEKRPDPHSDSDYDAQHDKRPDPHSDSEYDLRYDKRPDTYSDSEVASHHDNRPASKPFSNLTTTTSAPKPSNKTTLKSAPTSASISAPMTAPKTAPNTTPKTAPKLTPKPTSIPTPKPAPKPAPKYVPVPRRFNVTESAKWADVSLQVTDLVVSNNCCNELNALDLNKFAWLRSIEIGDNCFASVQTFKIDGLNRLKSVKIGRNSFTQVKEEKWSTSWSDAVNKANHKSKSFHIVNCESLESVEIGECSFSDFAGQLEFKNLTFLKSIKIGEIGSKSYNFFWSSFVIQGIGMLVVDI